MYCRGSSHSDNLSNKGMAWAGAGASMGPWLGGYKGTRRSRQRAGRRAGVSMTKQVLSGSIRSWKLSVAAGLCLMVFTIKG